MEFDSIQTFKGPLGLTSLILFTSSAAPCIAGFIYVGDLNRSPVDLPDSISLPDFLQLPATNRVAHLGLVICPAPITTTTIEEFREAMAKAVRQLPHSLLHSPPNGLVLWLTQIGDFTLDAVAHLRLVYAAPDQAWQLDDTSASPLLPPGGSMPMLAVPATGMATVLSPGADGSSLVLGNAAGTEGTASIGYMQSDVAAFVVQLGGALLTIPLATQPPFATTITAVTAAAFRDMPIGFTYALTAMPGLSTTSTLPDAAMHFPLLDPSEAFTGWSVTMALAPQGGPDAAITMQLQPPTEGGTFLSAYRTPQGEIVTLAPQQSNGLVLSLQTCIDNVPRFQPTGGFALNLATPTSGGFSLLCGLAGLESITVPATGAVLLLQSNPGAGTVWMTVSSDPYGQPGYRLPASTATPGYAAVSMQVLPPTAGGTACSYATQSQQAPLFGAASPTCGVLSLLPVNAGGLPDAQQVTGFPLLPYAGVAPMASGPGSLSDGFAGFETNFIAAQRMRIIENYPSFSANPVSVNSSLTSAVTPQGFIASLQSSGNTSELTSLTLASLSGTASNASVSFTGAPSLPASLLETFLANQPFVVITTMPSAYGYNAAANLDGWAFDLGMPSSSSGSYGTVLIIKAAAGSLSQLAATPAAWTNYGSFNDTSFDPQGQLLSSYICGYLNNARQLYAGGNGLQELETFITLIDDPDWSGILYLAPPLDPTQCDASLKPLLVGMDGTQITAHHLGIAANQVTRGAESGYQQNSSFFGLMRYVRPGTPLSGQLGGSSGYVASNQPYDFQVLLLNALFLNSVMKTFQSSAQLVLNQMFSDPVTAMPPSATAPGSNTIPLNGSANVQADGSIRYALSVPDGFCSTFYIGGAAVNQITIDKVDTTFNPSGEDGDSCLTFGFHGWFGFRGDTAFDLLSYSSIAFSGLSLAMTYNPDQFPIVPGFAEDISNVAVTPLTEQAAAGTQLDTTCTPGVNIFRPGSLGGQMPVQINRLVIGQSGTDPTSYGYLALKTSTSTGSVNFSNGPWAGLVLDLGLGSDGAAGSKALLAGQFMIAWQPGASDTIDVACAPYFNIVGPDGFSLSLNVEGVLRFGAQSVTLTQIASGNDAGRFMLSLESIGLTVLSKTFPQPGSANLYLAGFPTAAGGRALGWFGGYTQASGS